MIIGALKEDLTSEKRVALTPETAKSIIGLGLKACIERNYATHMLQFKPGTDVALLNSIMHVILEENLFDEEYIKIHTKYDMTLYINKIVWNKLIRLIT